MKLLRTKEYQFGWLLIFPLIDVALLMIFFLLLSSNFVLQPGILVNVPFSKFMLAPQVRYQVISIPSGATVIFAIKRFRSMNWARSLRSRAKKVGPSLSKPIA